MVWAVFLGSSGLIGAQPLPFSFFPLPSEIAIQWVQAGQPGQRRQIRIAGGQGAVFLQAHTYDGDHNLGLVHSTVKLTESAGLCSFQEVWKPKTHSDSIAEDQILDSNKDWGNRSQHLPAVHKRGRPWYSALGPAWSSGTAAGSGTHMAALGTHVLAAVLMEVPVVASMG